ncbi:hypothetical protein P168DRAFT_330363 [Aspergillus campestris IBT 28561]|uniref:RelA/SpoT domain-containing protein n=1 Tax=Aspergillus campestris (strain IBT 28561) TaxID=1392248 RepID=A0A2I1CSG2_ASPC2|nr:uncharacterized protein P168DRAFT_330363 [Aspergillus campestris IBT 28561]PKY00554.1 hypothetical protein P168DRAFT_330363 [Aspergillus campestris IBT 28561]
MAMTSIVITRQPPEVAVIESFLVLYEQNQSLYEYVTLAATRLCRASLGPDINFGITNRVKSRHSLKNKLYERHPTCSYRDHEQINSDIVDLAGVRITLPASLQIEQVGSMIREKFDLREEKIISGDEQGHDTHRAYRQTHATYRAVHYRVRMKQEQVPLDSAWQTVPVEIQVRSKAWDILSDFTHGLLYKPECPATSQQIDIHNIASSIVDSLDLCLNKIYAYHAQHLVIANTNFATKSSLESAMLQWAQEKTGRMVNDVGDIETLWKFLQALDLHTPNKLKATLAKLDTLQSVLVNVSGSDYVTVDLATPIMRAKLWSPEGQTKLADIFNHHIALGRKELYQLEVIADAFIWLGRDPTNQWVTVLGALVPERLSSVRWLDTRPVRDLCYKPGARLSIEDRGYLDDLWSSFLCNPHEEIQLSFGLSRLRLPGESGVDRPALRQAIRPVLEC